MFLNMLIAIMGDAFDQATEKREINATSTKLKIMGDYVDLIVRDEDEKQEESEEEIDSDNQNTDVNRLSDLFPKNDSEPVNDEKFKEKQDMILYIVEPVVDAANEQASWEGHMSALKR